MEILYVQQREGWDDKPFYCLKSGLHVFQNRAVQSHQQTAPLSSESLSQINDV